MLEPTPHPFSSPCPDALASAVGVAHVPEPGMTWSALVGRIDRRLDMLLPPAPPAAAGAPHPLAPSMRHAVLAPGKRVRALLALQAGRELGADDAAALDAGCAVELLHAASLVFDDLPAMDNAALRRGLPATHVAHGEATAMLAAVSLIAQAFSLVNGLAQLPAEARCAMVGVLASAIGSDGMAAGQQLDVAPLGGHTDLHRLEQVGEQKTGSLFIAAIEVGAIAGRGNAGQRARLRRYAQHVGVAFQIADDLVDEAEDTGRDTYVGLLGRAGAQALLQDHLRAARDALLHPRGALMQLTQALFAAHLSPEQQVA